MNSALIDPLWADMIRHTVGAGKHIAKSKRGYRNHYNASIGGVEHQMLLAMVDRGLMRAGVVINNGTAQYFYATKAGCNAIMLHKAATDRAMEAE